MFNYIRLVLNMFEREEITERELTIWLGSCDRYPDWAKH